MESQQTTPDVSPQTAPAVAPAPAVTPQAPLQTMETGGVMESVAKPKMNMKDILISLLLITVSIYGIVYYRKAIKNLDEAPTGEEFDNLIADVEEVKFNVEKALGKKYQKT